MPAIDATRRTELTQLVDELGLAARTARGQTLVERAATRDELVAAVRERIEAHPEPDTDTAGLEALAAWTDALERADITDLDVLQEVLYGIGALVRCHLWHEAGVPLAPPGRLTGDG